MKKPTGCVRLEKNLHNRLKENKYSDVARCGLHPAKSSNVCCPCCGGTERKSPTTCRAENARHNNLDSLDCWRHTDVVVGWACLPIRLAAASCVERPLALLFTIAALPFHESILRGLRQSSAKLFGWSGTPLHECVTGSAIFLEGQIVSTGSLIVNANAAITIVRITHPHRERSEATKNRGITPWVCLKLRLVLCSLEPESVVVQFCCKAFFAEMRCCQLLGSDLL